MIKPWLATCILLLAAIAWIANFVLSAVLKNYQASESVNTIFLTIITGVLTAKLHEASPAKDDQERPPTKPHAIGEEGSSPPTDGTHYRQCDSHHTPRHRVPDSHIDTINDEDYEDRGEDKSH